MTGTAELAVVPEGDCIRLTLQRPGKGNALSHSLVQALHGAVLDAVRARPRLVVVEGAGPHFCTGFDLSGLEEETDASLLARFELVERLLQALSAAPFPTLAIAQGRAMGAGADIFCACSNRWIAGDATFAFPGAGFGLVLGTARLADTVGAATAQGWVMGGAQITADAALAAQLAHRRVAPEALAGELAATYQAMRRLDDETHAAIHEATSGARRPRGTAGDADDMTRLLRSASRPGLKARIAAYRAAGARAR